MEEDQKARLRTYAWNYFAYHADQRMKAFHFYLLTVSALSAGLIALVPKAGGEITRLPSCMCFGITILSVVFGFLDRRNAQLVKNGERALAHLDRLEEHADDLEPHVLQLFDADEHQTKGRSGNWHISYTDLLRFVFYVFAVSFFGLGFKLW